MTIFLVALAMTTYWGIPTGAWVVIGTIVSGAALKYVDKFIRARTENRDDNKNYRDEIKELRERVDKLEEEVTEWRKQYYAEQDYSQRLRTQILKTGTEPVERKA